MKLLTIILSFSMFFSCGKKEEKETEQDYPTVEGIAASYKEQLNAYSIEQLFPDRCDRLTFLALAASILPSFDISAYEWNSGEWHRDVKACYPDASKSEVSFDNLISVLHKAQTDTDQGLLLRLREFGDRNKWVMGLGDRNLTYLPQLKYLINDMLGEHNSPFEGKPMSSIASFTLSSSHKEHILGLSAWLKMRYAGYLTNPEFIILKNLKRNPLINALVARLHDGNQEETIKYLESFPEKLPLETGIVEWGSAPNWLYFFILKAVIDGR